MWSAVRGRGLWYSTLPISQQWRNLASTSISSCPFSSSAFNNEGDGGVEKNTELLSLAEVEKILKDVQADDVKVLKAPTRCEFTDYMVIATGRSPWHVRNISQALMYKVKQKQKGAKRMLLPSVVGQEGGKWIVMDAGKVIVHAVDENVRAYYNFEGLWKAETSNTDADHYQDLEDAFIKVRRKNNSKKRYQPQGHS